MKKIAISFFALALLALPAVVLAQDFTYVNNWVDQLVEWTQRAVTFLMVVATLWFIWTVIQYIREKDAAKVKDRKNAMVRGIIGLFVIVAIWGIVRIVGSTLGVRGGSLNPDATPCPPGMTYSTIDRRCR